MTSCKLEFPLAVKAMNEISVQGCKTHPGEQDPWPPPYSDYDNLTHAKRHLNEYMLEGKVIDEHGINVLEKVLWRVAAVVERQRRVAGEHCEKHADKTVS